MPCRSLDQATRHSWAAGGSPSTILWHSPWDWGSSAQPLREGTRGRPAESESQRSDGAIGVPRWSGVTWHSRAAWEHGQLNEAAPARAPFMEQHQEGRRRALPEMDPRNEV